jgi:hypothetical protein
MMKKAISLLMALSLSAGSLLTVSHVGMAASPAGTHVLPLQDVTVYSNGYQINANLAASDGVNYHKHVNDGGETDRMRAGLQQDGASAYTYVKYDITTILPLINSETEVALAFKTSSLEPTQMSVYGLHPLQTAADWSESTMTWKSKFLQLTDSIDTITITNTPSDYQFNLTDYVKESKKAGKSVVGFVIKAETPGAIEMRGHETNESASEGLIPTLIVNEQSTNLHAPQPYTPSVPFEYGKNMPPLNDTLVYNPVTTNNKDADKNYHSTNNVASIADGMTAEFNKSVGYYKFDISNLPDADQIGKTLFSVWGRQRQRPITFKFMPLRMRGIGQKPTCLGIISQ